MAVIVNKIDIKVKDFLKEMNCKKSEIPKIV